ncbi:MAG: hypothetical protein JSV62_12075 [Promethearchaeota archaeon]|nr:MAG: hypothetical protein JSV62_12075 [Candidatus Lokiarchaeota archaeon]
MNDSEYKYNFIEENRVLIRDDYKIKGKEYVIINLNKKQINALTECTDLLSVAPLVSPKFSNRIEKFLMPRFDELTKIIYSIKTLPDELQVEISKENHDDLIKSFSLVSVRAGLEDRGYSIEDLKKALGKVKYYKWK